MLQNTDLHIVFNGSLGTLSELGMTWISSWIHEPNKKPIILYGLFWQDIVNALAVHMCISAEEIKILKILGSPTEVLEYIKSIDAKQGV